MTRRWCTWWVGAFVLWVLCVATLEPSELLTGAVAAALAATVAHGALLLEPTTLRPEARWLARVPRVVPATLVDCGLLAAALARRLVGGPGAAPASAIIGFDVGCVDDEASNNARRAAITEALSFTPNVIVLDIDAGGHGTAHRLVPGSSDPTRILQSSR